jgi:excisionase family DNA binding protein
VKEAGDYLGISARTIYNTLKEFPVKPLRLGRAVRFDIRDLDAYVERLKNGA